MGTGTIITTVGMGWQLLGLGIAGLGVRNVRLSRAPERGMWNAMKAFGLRNLFRPRSSITTANSADAGAFAENARVKTGLAPDATAEQRNQFVLGELSWLRKAVSDLREEMAAERRERNTVVGQVDAANREAIDSFVTEGLTQQTAGLSFAVLGSVLTIIGTWVS